MARPLIGSPAAMRAEPLTEPPDMPDEHVSDIDLDQGQQCECIACCACYFNPDEFIE